MDVRRYSNREQVPLLLPISTCRTPKRRLQADLLVEFKVLGLRLRGIRGTW